MRLYVNAIQNKRYNVFKYVELYFRKKQNFRRKVNINYVNIYVVNTHNPGYKPVVNRHFRNGKSLAFLHKELSTLCMNVYAVYIVYKCSNTFSVRTLRI